MQKFRSVVDSLPNPRRRFFQHETSQHQHLPVLYVANGYVVTCAIVVIATETHECIDARRLNARYSIAEYTAGSQGRIIPRVIGQVQIFVVVVPGSNDCTGAR